VAAMTSGGCAKRSNPGRAIRTSAPKSHVTVVVWIGFPGGSKQIVPGGECRSTGLSGLERGHRGIWEKGLPF
jgi:hypothetical protein